MPSPTILGRAVIVRRDGDRWILIKQMDHARHCGDIADAWRAGMCGPDSVSPSLAYAARWHDLGWTEEDARPKVDAEGKPRNFTQADEARHTDFCARAVRTIAHSDLYAAYLVSLHLSGLYSGRYGWGGLQPVDWTDIGPDGRRMLADERQFRAGLVDKLSGEEAEFEAAWRNFMLLEAFDYISLLTCFGFHSEGCWPVPTLPGRWERVAVHRLGPLEVQLDPFPFPGKDLVLDVECMHLKTARFESDEHLRHELAVAEPSILRTVYRAG
jgi:hypothetical protein